MKSWKHVKTYLYLPVQIAVGVILAGVVVYVLHYGAHVLGVGH